MSDFDALLAAALLGTGRTALPVHAGTALSGALNALGGSVEETLLARAALAGLVQLAGRTPLAPASPRPAPAPPELRPEAPPRAARHLPLVMGTPLLPEWLSLCAAAGWRVPAAALPGLLDQARRDTGLREALRPVLGERGAWLAAFSPEWRFAAPASLPDVAAPAGESDPWAEASDAGREALFRTLRDRDPQAAHELLRSTFAAERAGTRRRLLSVLLSTLTSDDQSLEPLLEEALDDRSAEVAHLAREALRSWPLSALNARLAARARDLWPEADLTGDGWTAADPSEAHQVDTGPRWRPAPPPDAAAARDGLRPEQHAGAPDFLRALLATTHPETLLAALGLAPEALVALARHLGALDALAGRVVAARHAPTAQALLRAGPPTLALLRLGPPEGLLGPLRQALAAEQAGEACDLLAALPSPWPAALSAQVLAALRRRLSTATWASGWDGQWQRLQTLAAQHADPWTPGPLPLPDESPEYARRAVDELRRVLSRRAQMHADFSPEAFQGAAP